MTPAGTRRPWPHRPSPRRQRQRRRAKLRTRVLVGALLVTVTALAVFDVAAVTALRRYLLAHTDGQLRNVTSLYRPFSPPLSLPGSPRHLAVYARRPPGYARISGLQITGPRVRLNVPILDRYYLEFLRGHRARTVLVAGNPSLRPRQLPWVQVVRRQRTATVIGVNGRTQLRLQAVPIGGGTLVATTSLADVNTTVDRLRLILIICSVAAALLVAGGVAFVVRRGLLPIETMASQADRITAGDLTERVSAQDAATEVGRLSTALNGMLGRIETSIREREASQELTHRFFADASHELRNPLASLRANAELYQQGALTDGAAVDEAMRRISLEARRMSGLVDDMLRLARLDQHPDQRDDAVDLTALLTGCAERARAADPLRTWHASIAPDLKTSGDEELLCRAVDNLLANVRTHTPEGTAAIITAASCDGGVVVEVSDDGPGVCDAELSQIFHRFYRAGAPSPQPGSGLGLAIAAAIANSHGGVAEATRIDPHGLRVTLTLPERGRLTSGPHCAAAISADRRQPEPAVVSLIPPKVPYLMSDRRSGTV